MPDATPLAADLVYDVGMHRGEDTAFYLAKGYRVVAFEASPTLVAAAEARFAKEIAEGRVILVPGAITEPGAGETVTFFQHENSVLGTVDQTWNERNVGRGGATTVEVPTVDFVAALREHGVPAYLKVDIEGVDRWCLEQLRAFDARPWWVSIESSKRSLAEVQAELDLLLDLGYDAFVARQQAGIEKVILDTHTLGGAPLRHQFELHSSGPFGSDLDGDWQSLDAVVDRYRAIMRDYERWGDDTVWMKSAVAAKAAGALARLARRPLPGWYDTHARHASAPR